MAVRRVGPPGDLSVLLLAELANPTQASVPLIGWRNFEAMRSIARVHLVTQVRNRTAILDAGVRADEVTFVDTEWIARPTARLARLVSRGGLGWTMPAVLGIPGYIAFEHAAWRMLADDVRGGRFDVVHRVTPVSPASPSPFASWCRREGVPFVLGPLNGGVSYPVGWRRRMIAEGELLLPARRLQRLVPGWRATRVDASAVIVASRSAEAEVPRGIQSRIVRIPENGVPDDLPLRSRPPRPRDGQLRLVCAGRLVPLKGVDIALEASAAVLRSGRAQLHVLGDGPSRQALVALADRLGIGQAVEWEGWCSQEHVFARLLNSDVLLFPSVREFGGGVVLEAMAAGAVPVVCDHGGPPELVRAGGGVIVPIGGRAELIAGFKSAVESLDADTARLDVLSRAARRRTRDEFTWGGRAIRLRRLYCQLLAGEPQAVARSSECDAA